MRSHTEQVQGQDAADELALKAGKGNLQRKASGTAPPGSPGSALQPLIGLPVKDGGGYTFVLDPDLAFRVIGTPPGGERATGKRLTADDASAKVAAAWSTLAERLQHEHPAAQPAVPEAGPAPVAAPREEPSLIASALETVRDVAGGARDYLHGLFSGVTDGIGGFLSGGSETAPRRPPPRRKVDGRADQAPVESTGPTTPAPIPIASVDGKKDSLAVAKQLADTLNVPHTYERAQFVEETKDDLTGTARTDDMLAGGANMKSINCSEFVSATLAEAGWDLKDEYRDPATGLPVAYHAGKRLKFCSNMEVINIGSGDTAAVLAVQTSGGGEHVVAGSDRATALGGAKRTCDFLYATTSGIGDGVAVDESMEFGAGAAAASMGGRTIERDDRRPGDLQQAFKTNGGIATGKGHSSQVWSVRGPGVARLGEAGGPTIIGNPATPLAELEPGWYEIDGDTLMWEVGPDTDPACVARLTAASVQTIDANIGRGADGTGVGGFEKQTAFSKEGASTAYSDGRLPTSRWFDWQPQGRRRGGGPPQRRGEEAPDEEEVNHRPRRGLWPRRHRKPSRT